MKNISLAIVGLAVIVGFVACGGKSSKSNECEIISFKVDGKFWSLEGHDIIGPYEDKSILTNAKPEIAIKGARYKITPELESYDFSEPGYFISITVTAEDGSTSMPYKAMLRQP